MYAALQFQGMYTANDHKGHSVVELKEQLGAAMTFHAAFRRGLPQVDTDLLTLHVHTPPVPIFPMRAWHCPQYCHE